MLNGCITQPSRNIAQIQAIPEQAATTSPTVQATSTQLDATATLPSSSATTEDEAPSESITITDHTTPLEATTAPASFAATPTPVIMANQEVKQWPAQRGQLSPGNDYTGTLAEGDGVLNDDTLFDVYEFEGGAGLYVTLTLESQEFDPFLVLVDPNKRVLASNDDLNSKLGPGSQLRLGLGEAGSYQVWVNSSAGETGMYTLSMTTEDRSGSGGAIAVGDSVQGWLLPGDQLDENKHYVDTWTILMPADPVIVWVKSNEFDTLLRAIKPNGTLLIQNDDANFVSGDGNSRVVLAPSKEVPVGTELRLEVALPGEHALGGQYDLKVIPLAPTYEVEATLKLQPIIVSGSQITEQQIVSALADANKIWNACKINVELADNTTIQTVQIDELKNQMKAGERAWTKDETMLQEHPSHALYEQRVITAYFVSNIDGGDRYGIAYPSTRYPSRRSGLLAIADAASSSAGMLGQTLAHEIGHILGLEHPNPVTGDGDPWNDTKANLMNDQESGHKITPLQCLTARSDPHYLHREGIKPLVTDDFLRNDRVLLPGEVIDDALTTQSISLHDGRYLEVFYFYGKKGQQVTIDLISTDFDPVLWLDGPGDERIVEDDDTGTEWNASITLVLPTDGDYSIGVTSYEQAVGAYRLRLRTNR